MNTELQALIWVVLAGMLVGLIFDFYRIFRKQMRWGKFLTGMGDFLFSFTALGILIYFFLKANALDLRFYIFWGSLLGLALYLVVLSPWIVRILLRLFYILSWLWGRILQILKIPQKLLHWFMEFPYGLLRWLSMLAYRMGEAIWGLRFKQKVKRVKIWWAGHFPPKED